eukprot:gene27863-12969_t
MFPEATRVASGGAGVVPNVQTGDAVAVIITPATAPRPGVRAYHVPPPQSRGGDGRAGSWQAPAGPGAA